MVLLPTELDFLRPGCGRPPELVRTEPGRPPGGRVERLLRGTLEAFAERTFRTLPPALPVSGHPEAGAQGGCRSCIWIRCAAFGVDPLEHDIRFEEDNWESPTLGAAGVGWQVVMDGMEISQFTYFQQTGGRELAPISVELTYGIERICMFLNDIRNVYDIPWNESY